METLQRGRGNRNNCMHDFHVDLRAWNCTGTVPVDSTIVCSDQEEWARHASTNHVWIDQLGAPCEWQPHFGHAVLASSSPVRSKNAMPCPKLLAAVPAPSEAAGNAVNRPPLHKTALPIKNGHISPAQQPKSLTHQPTGVIKVRTDSW